MQLGIHSSSGWQAPRGGASASNRLRCGAKKTRSRSKEVAAQNLDPPQEAVRMDESEPEMLVLPSATLGSGKSNRNGPRCLSGLFSAFLFV